MPLTFAIKLRLLAILLIAILASAVMTLHYMRLPATLFGVGQYTIRIELPEAAGLYERANVTYRGAQVGKVTRVSLTDRGAEAEVSLTSNVPISSDLDAEVHSMSAIGEQYIALVPQSASSPPIRGGDVIPVDRVSVPPSIDRVLGDANRGLQAIPHDSLKTLIDESAIAVGGLGPDIARLVKGSAALAIDARKDLDALVNVIDHSKPVLDSQTGDSGAVATWAANLATITSQLETNDPNVASVLKRGPPAAAAVRNLFDRLQPTLPVLLSNLVAVEQVALVYQPNIEQLLVLVPTTVAFLQQSVLANKDVKQDFKGAYVAFHSAVNVPPACTTGYLPPQQIRPPALVDAPDRPEADLFCRVPQDSPYNVRGLRNIPCAGKPWKRAPTAKICESDEVYVPLNDGLNWKGDGNATLSGQDVLPQPPPATPQPPPPVPVAMALYDPATGQYVGPDGQLYTQSNLAGGAQTRQTWQSMLMPPPTP